MAEAIKCDYIHSSEYRGFVNALAKESIALSNGVWWVTRGTSIVGPVYYLYRNREYIGDVRKEDAHGNGVESALWKLMKYLEGFMRYTDWSILVFPNNWNGTSWYAKSFEFVVMNGVRSKNEWDRFMSSELDIR